LGSVLYKPQRESAASQINVPVAHGLGVVASF
jgi:hypothetical protein